MKRKIKIIRFYFIFVIFSIVYILISYRHYINEYYLILTTDYDEEPYDSFMNTSDIIYKTNCNPINRNFQQFAIKFENNQTYPKYLPLYQNKSINYECLNRNPQKKLILFWNKWFANDPYYEYGSGAETPFKLNNCPVTNCEITTDKKKTRESNIIVFHMRQSIFKFPKYRHPDQRWVFLLYESPKHSSNYIKYNKLFNLTATYSSTSNFVSYYYSNSLLEWGFNKNFNINRDFSINKTKFAAALISNCDDKSQRLELIKELSRYIPIKIYGKCGTPCPNNCKEYIGKNYKFFLSFENSICEDYITEKFFDVLKYDIIPVTYGAGDYIKYIPSTGFVNIFDFTTLRKLADYLWYLDFETTAYNSYFKWKQYLKYNPEGAKNGHFCEMCIQLNLDFYFGIKKNVISNLETVWGEENNCYENRFSTKR